MTATITTTRPTDDRPEFLDGFARMHDAMRRDMARLPHAIAAATDESATAAVLRWYKHFRATLEHHHEREDTIIWPELVRRDPSFAAPQAVLLEDHHVLDAALEAVEAALTGGGDIARRADELAAVLVDHLAREEAAAFPRLAACFTPDEWAAVEHSFVRGTSVGHLAFEIPWVMDGLADDEVARLKAQAPRALRVAYRLAFAPRYARIAAPIVAAGR